MDWFYADGQEKRGPLPEAQMRALVAAATIKPETLVWHAGLAQWKPARDTALMGGAAPAGTEPQKAAYSQSRREGAPLPTAAGAVNARRDGQRIVVPVENARLPLRCVKTNAAVTEAELVNKKLYWCNPWVALAILLNLIIYIILHYVLRKLVQLDIPISAAGRGIVRKHILIAWLLALGGIAAIIGGIANANFFILVGFLLLIAGLVYGSFRGSALRVTKLRNGEAWLAGACPEYLEALPPYA